MTIETIERKGRTAYRINAGQVEYIYFDRTKAEGFLARLSSEGQKRDEHAPLRKPIIKDVYVKDGWGL